MTALATPAMSALGRRAGGWSVAGHVDWNRAKPALAEGRFRIVIQSLPAFNAGAALLLPALDRLMGPARSAPFGSGLTLSGGTP